MSGFKVDTDALRAFESVLSDCRFDARMLGADAVSLQAVGEHFGGMLYGDLVTMHDDTVYPRVRKRMGYVETCLERSRDEVGRTAKHYGRTDKRRAAELDAQYPGADSTPRNQTGGEYGPPESVDDAFGPYRTITEYTGDPADSDVDGLQPKGHAVVEGMATVADWLSPFYWARQGLTQLCGGYDVFGEGFKALGGDWAGWAKAALKWRDFGNAHEALAGNVDLHHGLDFYWAGNAADAARAYFDDVTTAVEAEVEYYRDFLYPGYKKIVEMVYRDFKAVEFLYSSLVDAIVTMGASLFVQSGKAVAHIIKIVETISGVLGGTAAGMNSVIAGIVGHEGPGEPECLIGRPRFQEGYDHPGAD